MDDEDRYKAFAAYAEISRKWVAIMDAKAGFLAALNLGMLAFLWTGVKLYESKLPMRWCALVASFFSLSSVLCAIWVALPREKLTHIFGRKAKGVAQRPAISYYGHIATTYAHDQLPLLSEHAAGLTFASLAEEALEQHLMISHSVAKKSKFVRAAGFLLLFALASVGAGLALKAFS